MFLELTNDDLESIQELKNLSLTDKGLRSLLFEEDDLDSLEELKVLLTKEEPSSTVSWVGDFEYQINSNEYPLLSIFRNNTTKTVYINSTHGWTTLVKDGEKGPKGDNAPRSYAMGGGLGERDVLSLIDQKLSAYSPSTSGNTFTGTISANNVLVDSSSFTLLSGTSASDIFEQIDNKIATKILLGQYQTNDVIETGNTTDDVYVGKSDPTGKWYIRRIRTLSEEDIEIRHANISNNNSHATYSDAINNFIGLNYDLLHLLSF